MSDCMGPYTAPDRDRVFERLVEEYQEPVLRMCYFYLCDKTQAEDAAQETFLKLYRTMDRYRGECSEKTWIMKIAIRTCYDINRSGWFRMMNRRVTPEMLSRQTVSDSREDAEVAEAVMKLPRKLKEVILLYYYQGMNVNETADALNITHSAVSERLRRGREKLKSMLEGGEVDEQEDQRSRIP